VYSLVDLFWCFVVMKRSISRLWDIFLLDCVRLVHGGVSMSSINFGNGSPDVFSTFSAMHANSGSLAIGDLLGAASFILFMLAIDIHSSSLDARFECVYGLDLAHPSQFANPPTPIGRTAT